jgi:hypothetical protein
VYNRDCRHYSSRNQEIDELNIGEMINELKQERDRIEAAIRALEGATSKRATGNGRRKRTMSPEARAKIAAAAKRRWAAARKAGKTTLAKAS